MQGDGGVPSPLQMNLLSGSDAGGLSTSGSLSALSAFSVPSPNVFAKPPEEQRQATDHLNLENLRQVIEDNGEKLKTLFEMWDEDASGSINAKEFRNALKTLGFSASEAHMNALFEKLDKDKSGSIEYKELDKAIKGSGKKGKAIIESERKLREEKRANEAGQQAVLQALEQAKQQQQEVLEQSRQREQQLEQQLDAERQAAQQLQAQLEKEEEATREARREAALLRDEIDALKRSVGQWERRAAQWETADAERQRQLRDKEAQVEAAKQASQTALEARDAEIAVLKSGFEQERKQWAEQKASFDERLSRLDADLERRKLEDAQRVALAGAILTSANDEKQRDDSMHFWQARRLPWRSAPSPSAVDESAAGDASRLAQSIGSQIGRLAEQLSASRLPVPPPQPVVGAEVPPIPGGVGCCSCAQPPWHAGAGTSGASCGVSPCFSAASPTHAAIVPGTWHGTNGGHGLTGYGGVATSLSPGYAASLPTSPPPPRQWAASSPQYHHAMGTPTAFL